MDLYFPLLSGTKPLWGDNTWNAEIIYIYIQSANKSIRPLLNLHTSTKCDIYWVSAQLGSKEGTEIFKYLTVLHGAP